MIIKPGHNNIQQNAALTFLTVLSALLFSLSFPGKSLWFFIFVFLLPFLYVLENSRSVRQKCFFGFLFGILIAFGTGYWLITAMTGHYSLAPITAISFFLFVIALPAGGLTALFSMAYVLFKQQNLFFYALFVPSCWTLYEYILEVIPVFTPWPLAGNAIIPWNRFIQIADITGVYGLTYIIILINSLIFYGLYHVGPLSKKHLPAIAILLFSFLIPVMYGSFKQPHSGLLQNDKNKWIQSAVVVQGSIDLKERWHGLEFASRLASYLDLTGKNRKASDKQRIILWPETMLNLPDKKKRDAVITRIKSSLGNNFILITGGLRTSETKNGFYNSAYVISDSAETRWYDKKILLPYTEYSPGGILIGQFYNAPSEFLHGKLPQIVQTASGNAGISICFEVVYSNHVRKSVKYGAGFLANISNDSWFGTSGMPEMHMNISRLRAVENRRFMLRSSNSGLSVIIAPDGRIIKQLGLNQKGAIISDIAVSDMLSFYTRYGNLIILFSISIVTLFFISLFISKKTDSG